MTIPVFKKNFLMLYQRYSSNTHISFLREVFLNADSDSLQSGLPFLRGLVQLRLQLLDVLQHQKQPRKMTNVTYDTTNKHDKTVFW